MAAAPQASQLGAGAAPFLSVSTAAPSTPTRTHTADGTPTSDRRFGPKFAKLVPAKPDTSPLLTRNQMKFMAIGMLFGAAIAGITAGVAVWLGKWYYDAKDREQQLLATRDIAATPTGWSYIAGAYNGPERWGMLVNDTSGELQWPECGLRGQSPVDIDATLEVTRFFPLLHEVTADRANVFVRPDGLPGVRIIPVIHEGQKAVTFVDNQPFDLKYIEFHAPSEHTIGGEHFPMEATFVHENPANGELATLSLLYSEIDLPNSMFYPFWSDMYLGPIDIPMNLASIISNHPSEYYRYTGSLTAPPCTRNVNVFVARATEGVNPFQVHTFKYITPQDNNRPIQSLHDRELFKYGF